jgi:hypothetical protein
MKYYWYLVLFCRHGLTIVQIIFHCTYSGAFGWKNILLLLDIVFGVQDTHNLQHFNCGKLIANRKTLGVVRFFAFYYITSEVILSMHNCTNHCFQIRLPVDISSNLSIQEANCCDLEYFVKLYM